jgi:hypothetical protein
LAAMILSGCQPTKEYSQSNVNLLNAMVYAKKDGQCFGIIVSSTYGAHDVVSVTLVPMELCK